MRLSSTSSTRPPCSHLQLGESAGESGDTPGSRTMLVMSLSSPRSTPPLPCPVPPLLPPPPGSGTPLSAVARCSARCSCSGLTGLAMKEVAELSRSPGDTSDTSRRSCTVPITRALGGHGLLVFPRQPTCSSRTRRGTSITTTTNEPSSVWALIMCARCSTWSRSVAPTGGGSTTHRPPSPITCRATASCRDRFPSVTSTTNRWSRGPAGASCPSCTGNTARIVMVVPTPTSLWHAMLPPSRLSMMCFVITSPSPVPPYARVEVLLTWPKGRNMSAILSAGTPMPVSLTTNTTSRGSPCATRCSGLAVVTRSTTSPRSGVNLIALFVTLIIACRSRKWSPSSVFDPRCGSMSTMNSTWCAEACCPTMSTTSLQMSMSSKGSDTTGSGSPPPAELLLLSLAYSRICPMTPRSASAEVIAARTYSVCSGLRLSSSSSRLLKAMTLFSGVRSSCVMFATKLVCSWLTRSASALDWLSSRFAACTCCRLCCSSSCRRLKCRSSRSSTWSCFVTISRLMNTTLWPTSDSVVMTSAVSTLIRPARRATKGTTKPWSITGCSSAIARSGRLAPVDTSLKLTFMAYTWDMMELARRAVRSPAWHVGITMAPKTIVHQLAASSLRNARCRALIMDGVSGVWQTMAKYDCAADVTGHRPIVRKKPNGLPSTHDSGCGGSQELVKRRKPALMAMCPQ
mmetsp:Transcript_22336/g.75846  ORF Transcript_22336/g.75846 Transcript_22336/m.75846 type:complete len:686 (+) Transcript_22336:561-2618(+)